MCDVKAYVKQNDHEELLLEAVNQARVERGEVIIRNLFGEERRVPGVIIEVSLVRNRLVVERS